MRLPKFRCKNKIGNWCFFTVLHNGNVNEENFYLETLSQFTGLLDKQCVEIYEGDYLIDRFPVDEEDLSLGYNESFLPVVWCDKQLMWCVDVSFKKNGSYLTSLVEYFGEFLEIKGNIHEQM